MSSVTAGAQRPNRAHTPTETKAPPAFYNWLNFLQDNWATADLNLMSQELPGKPALQNILWDFQKLKVASAKGDRAGMQSTVKDMLARIDEGLKNGSLNASEAQTLGNLAHSFCGPRGGSLSARGALGENPEAEPQEVDPRATTGAPPR